MSENLQQDFDLSTTAGKLADFYARRERSFAPSGEAAIEKQHARGKNTARERIDMLLDEGSFVEFDALARHRTTAFGMDAKHPAGDGLVSGFGTVDGRQVAVYSQDFTVFGGSLSERNGQKIVKVQEFASRNGCPVVGILDGGGARIQEGVASLAQFADIFRNNVLASGMIPQISLIMGPSAGGAAYSPALTDVVVMVDQTSHMFITGPDVIKTVTGEDVDMETLGGARSHNATSGTAHYMASSEEDAIAYVQELLELLPSNNLAEAPTFEAADPEPTDEDLALDEIVPDSANQPYDMLEVIASIVDEGHLLQLQELYAPNVITGLARLDGMSVGVVANQPMVLAGCLDIDSSRKAARFVRFCDAFEIPILTLVDVPGFLPGTGQEYGGVIKHGAKLLFAYGEATVPKVTVITRKAYGGAYDVMASKHLRGDFNYAWPTAEIAVMGAKGAVEILYRSELGDADKIAARTKDYEDRFANPFVAAEKGFIDEVIQPRSTRRRVARAFASLRGKQLGNPWKKHDNIPL